MKTTAVKRKAATKIAKAKRKVSRKCKGKCASVSAVAAAVVLALVSGCATSDNAQPAKANSMNNTFNGCTIVVATRTSVSNRVVTAEGTQDMPAVEVFTQTQSLENSGTETTSQTNTQTPSVSTPVRIDARYNDVLAAATPASKGVIEQLIDASANAVLAIMASRKSGTVAVEKKDGTKGTVECNNGQCAFSNPGSGCTDCPKSSPSTGCTDCTASDVKK